MVDFSKKPWIKDLPNQLTLFRIASVPVLLFIYPYDSKVIKVLCAALFTLAAFTDWLDGFVARRYNLESKLGALLDPIADKMLICACLVLVTAEKGALAPWMAGLLLCREMGITGLRLVALEQQIEIQVSNLGKWKTLVMDFAIGCLMVNFPFLGFPFRDVGMFTIWISLFLSLYSAYLYFIDFIKKANF